MSGLEEPCYCKWGSVQHGDTAVNFGINGKPQRLRGRRDRRRERVREREGRLLNKTSWEHFHVSPCWMGWRKPKLDLSSTATKAPSNQQLLLRRSSSRKHNQCKGNLFKQELISHGLVTANTDTLRGTDHLGNYSLWEDQVLVLQLTSAFVTRTHTHTKTHTPNWHDIHTSHKVQHFWHLVYWYIFPHAINTQTPTSHIKRLFPKSIFSSDENM